MAALEIYYYLKRMDEDLQEELKPKLAEAINLDSKFLVLEPQSAVARAGIIHASQRNNIKDKINSADFDLLLFLIQGAGKPKEAKEMIQESFPNVPLLWECGTEYLIEHFEKFEQYLKGTALKDWCLKGWVSLEPQHLSALAILCQGYLAVYGVCDSLESETDLAFLQNHLKGKESQVSDVHWWLDVFDLWDETTQKIDPQKWHNFEGAIAQEWETESNEPLAAPVTQLLQAIQESSTQLQQSQVIAKAYQAIASWLESQS